MGLFEGGPTLGKLGVVPRAMIAHKRTKITVVGNFIADQSLFKKKDATVLK